MDIIFTILYPVVAFISFFAFLPQIRTLLKAKSSPINVSILSYLSWLSSALIGLGYGLFCLQDTMFAFVSGLSAVMNIIVIGLVLYNRHVLFGEHDSITGFFLSCIGDMI